MRLECSTMLLIGVISGLYQRLDQPVLALHQEVEACQHVLDRETIYILEE